MNTIIEKRIYITPRIEQIKLDNEISLVLVSGNPGEPGVTLSAAPDYFNPDPFKQVIG